MYYEMNVVKNGKHFFATAERSCTHFVDAMKLYRVLKSKFPEEEGYEIQVTKWESTGHPIDME